MEDKEAQEKIDWLAIKLFNALGDALERPDYKAKCKLIWERWWLEFPALLEELGYHKPPEGKPPLLEAENRKLRELLWLHHGCPVVGLYGDDGEMQCAQSPKHIIDFKRMSVEDLELWLTPEPTRNFLKAMRDGTLSPSPKG